MRWISVLSLALLLMIPQTLPAQATGTVSGVITGTNGQPLQGAAVTVRGTGRGDQTGADGRFTITAVPAGSRVVAATFAGYGEGTRSVTVAAGQTATANIQLSAQAIMLEEVVAVGYGTARRRDLTGSVASVTAEDLTARAAPTTSVTSALVGRSPGVTVVANSATPGAAATVRIRGTNSITAEADPLYVIDGIPIGQGTNMSSIDPNNVESVQILKDASATAIYGARGANGVVLVTTKRGARGTNQFQVESSFGFQRPAKFIRALNSQEFRTLVNEGLVNAGRPVRFTQAQIDEAPYFDYPRELLQNLEWQPQQSHSLTVSGGDEQSRYLVAGSYLDQEGIIINSGFDRFTGRVNLDRTVSSRFRIGTSLSGTRTAQRVNGSESTGTGAGGSGVTSAVQYDPAVLPFDSVTGTWNRSVTLNENFNNPYTESVNRNQPNFTTAVLASLYGEYDLMEGLVLRSTVGGNFNFDRNKSYSPSFIATGNAVGVASQTSRERRELTNENIITYRRPVGPGTLEAMAGASIQTSHVETFTSGSRNFPVDELAFNNLGAGTELVAPSSGVTDWTLLSQLGRLNYNLLERYLFTVTARRDGSSRFGANNKWAIFPSAAFAWRVIDEPFMQNQSLLSDLKFRLSYGRTGNQAIEEYQSLARLTTAFIGLGSGTDVVTLVPETAAANPDLKWETQDQYNVGLDFGVLDNRVLLTADAYQSETSNLLLGRTLPWTTGYTSQLQNVGAVTNRGVELSLSTVNIDTDFFGWETTLNVSANRNEVSQLYGGLTELSAGSSTQVGEPLGTFVGFKVLGLYQPGEACLVITPSECQPGEYKLQDTDGNKVINNSDRVNLGNPQADYYGGLNSNMRFGPVTLDAFLNFSVGNEIYNSSMRYLGLVGGASNERADRSLRRWTPQNQNTDVPRANALRDNTRLYSAYIEDGTFVRLQTLSLSYQVPTGLVPAVEAARLTVTGQNLWIATDYSGYDPENQANDPGGYPRPRTWNVGVNLTF